MPDQFRPHFYVTGAARRDIAAILKWSAREFGTKAAIRYEALIYQALQDISADPDRPGSRDRTDILSAGARTYHLSLSRSRTTAPRVKEPRHLLVYRRRQDGVIEVGRILHDGRDIKRSVPAEYRS